MDTRQVLKFKYEHPIDVINEGLNNYLKQEKFIQCEYKGESVFKWNSLFAKQAFYKVYLKIHISESEVTIVGWSTYKGKEWGFDEMLDLSNDQEISMEEHVKPLYRFLWAISSGLKNTEDIYCKKEILDLAILPNTQNLFVVNLTWNEKADIPVMPSIILDILSIPIMLFVSSVVGIVMVIFSIIRIQQIAEFKNQNAKVKMVYAFSIMLAILYAIIIIIGIARPIIAA